MFIVIFAIIAIIMLIILISNLKWGALIAIPIIAVVTFFCAPLGFIVLVFVTVGSLENIHNA